METHGRRRAHRGQRRVKAQEALDGAGGTRGHRVLKAQQAVDGGEGRRHLAHARRGGERGALGRRRRQQEDRETPLGLDKQRLPLRVEALGQVAPVEPARKEGGVKAVKRPVRGLEASGEPVGGRASRCAGGQGQHQASRVGHGLGGPVRGAVGGRLPGNVAVPHHPGELHAQVFLGGVAVGGRRADGEAHHAVRVREDFNGDRHPGGVGRPVVRTQAGRGGEESQVGAAVRASLQRGDAVRRDAGQKDGGKGARLHVGTHQHTEGRVGLRGGRVLDGQQRRDVVEGHLQGHVLRGARVAERAHGEWEDGKASTVWVGERQVFAGGEVDLRHVRGRQPDEDGARAGVQRAAQDADGAQAIHRDGRNRHLAGQGDGVPGPRREDGDRRRDGRRRDSR